MNILVIGNGFDLAHELPTSYSDFLKFIDYIGFLKTTNKEYLNLKIINLKENISEKKQNKVPHNIETLLLKTAEKLNSDDFGTRINNFFQNENNNQQLEIYNNNFWHK